jgi:hypothetical protein
MVSSRIPRSPRKLRSIPEARRFVVAHSSCAEVREAREWALLLRTGVLFAL